MESKTEIKVKWTEDQQKAIDTRYCDVLVSAAAGSGKTAVLVERIIKIITNKDNPVNIDKLLIVTFTNAAAAEMRERIGEAISKKLEENPLNSNLQKQLTLLNKANISTLHSFCLNLIRNNFHVINIDPNFRVGDTTEISLLKQEALDELFEEKYNTENENFHNLIESYCDNKSDNVLYGLILRLYSFSMSTPSPVQWLLTQAENFNVENGFDINNFSFKDDFISEIKDEFKLVQKILNRALKGINENPALEKYRANIVNDLEIINTGIELLEISVKNCAEFIEENNFGKLAIVKLKNEEEKIMQEEIKGLRKRANDTYKGIKGKILSFISEDNLDKMNNLYPLMKELSSIVIDFKSKFDKKKRERGIIDFNDQEHFALEILKSKNDEGNEIPSEVAKGLVDKFEEILVDEYQDSNDVQEEIINFISRKNSDAKNRFMVGDLKQSIYRFRMAKPELFKEKKDTYSKEAGKDNRLITLHKNFRSREEVIDGINYIFNLAMSEKVGELNYTEEEELKLGADYKTLEEEGIIGGPVELHLIDLEDELIELGKSESVVLKKLEDNILSNETSNDLANLSKDSEKEEKEFKKEEKSEEEIEEEDLDAIQIEARCVAERIRTLMEYKGENTFKVFDKHINGYRQVTFRDIVILLRSGNKYAPVFVEEFKKLAIPLYAETGTGYFDTLEIKTIISLLQIIDNPMQDIPLISVLRSPIGAFTSEELADIRLINKKVSFFEAMGEFIIQEDKKEEKVLDALKNKIKEFFNQLHIWRNKSRFIPINQLIWELFTETGYYGYVGAMPGGVQRQANLKILFQRAKDFEKTSYKGLYNFVNFINNLQKTSEDLGAAKIIGENEDVVRVMSIHKSKGLEFPIVFLCGMGKQFNQSDLKSKILFHHELGFGPTFVDLDNRVTSTTAQREYISKKIDSENKSEEMRLLYVALTRAKEKLILVSSHKGLEKKIQGWVSAAFEEEDIIPDSYVAAQKSYIDWVAPTIIKHKDGEALRALVDNNSMEGFYEHKSKWEISLHSKNEFINKVSEEETVTSVDEKLQAIKDAQKNEELNTKIKENLGYRYKYEESTNLPTVVTVSKLKGKGIDKKSDEDLEESDDVEERLKDDYNREYSKKLIKMPKFLTEKKGLTPAEAGTALHSVMQRLDFNKVATVDEIQNQINMMINKELLAEEQGKVVKVHKIFKFVNSDLGIRVRKANENKTLKRELPFRMEIKSTLYDSRLDEEIYGNEKIVLRGIIDCFFIEGEEGVIVDYKTDYVSNGDVTTIVEKYKIQLNYYAQAVEKLLGVKVSNKYLYLFSTDEVLEV